MIDYEHAILRVLEHAEGWTSARALRDTSGIRRWWRSGPAFYQTMARLEDRGLVKARRVLVKFGFQREYLRKGLSMQQFVEAKELFDLEDRRCSRCQSLVPVKSDLLSLDITTHLCPECVQLERRLL